MSASFKVKRNIEKEIENNVNKRQINNQTYCSKKIIL